MKKKIIISAIALAIIFALAIRFSKKQTAADQSMPKEALIVTTQSAKNSTSLIQSIEYPAITAGDQQITLNANVSGTITSLSFDLGDKVFQGKQLAIIDEIGNNSEAGESGLKSYNVQALELAIESAEKKYKSAKKTYENDKTYANKKSKEVAKIDLETAEVNLRGALNSRLVAAPISGTITQRFVSRGDSVSVGQKIATISKTSLTKVQFFADKEDLSYLMVGTKISINEDGNIIPGIITRISPEADATTKRFLIEAKPAEKNPLLIGSVINVSLKIIKSPADPESLILPLSAITISQNESHIFIVENGQAKKINVNIQKVQGEYAEIKTDILPSSDIIIGGSKLVQDRENVTVKNN